MKIAQSSFKFLIAIAFLSSMGIFIAGTLIFLNIQLYAAVYDLKGPAIAMFTTLALTLLLVFVVVTIIGKKCFGISCGFERKEKAPVGPSGAAIAGIMAYELLSLYLKRKK